MAVPHGAPRAPRGSSPLTVRSPCARCPQHPLFPRPARSFATAPFTLSEDSLSASRVHLTNSSVQREHMSGPGAAGPPAFLKDAGEPRRGRGLRMAPFKAEAAGLSRPLRLGNAARTRASLPACCIMAVLVLVANS